MGPPSRESQGRKYSKTSPPCQSLSLVILITILIAPTLLTYVPGTASEQCPTNVLSFANYRYLLSLTNYLEHVHHVKATSIRARDCQAFRYVISITQLVASTLPYGLRPSPIPDRLGVSTAHNER